MFNIWFVENDVAGSLAKKHVLHCMTTSTCEESGNPAWGLSGDQRCLQIASLRHSCSLHALATTGICLVAYASCPVPKTPYIRHDDSQYHSPKCMLLPKMRPKIVWCCNVLQCMSNASHDWFHACAECIMGTGPGAVEESSPTSKATCVLQTWPVTQ